MHDKDISWHEVIVGVAIMLIIMIVVLPSFFHNNEGKLRKETACRSALRVLRTAVDAYRIEHGAWPCLNDLRHMQNIPANPYSKENAIRPFTIRGKAETPNNQGGWCYNPKTGEVWADTRSGAGEAGW